MGTTLVAKQAGSLQSVYVAAIEGYKYLLCTGSPAAAITAWAGTDWSLALPNLFVELHNEQKFNPWQPLQGGGTCTLRILADSTDQLGIDMAKKKTTVETELLLTADRAATTISVKATTGFAAATSEAFIGNECIEYSAIGTSGGNPAFTISKRGKYSPFAPGGTGTRWAEQHTVSATDPYATPPVMVQSRRDWEGAWVGVWEHRIVDGVLDTKANAVLVYAGQIAEYGDDGASTCTVIHLKHLLDVVKDSTIYRDQYRARIQTGITLTATDTFDAYDHVDSAADKHANSFTPGAGFYPIDDLLSLLNAWLGAEAFATRLTGTYTLSTTNTAGSLTVNVTARLNGVATTSHCKWTILGPSNVSWYLGAHVSQPPAATNGWFIFADTLAGGTTQTSQLPFPVRDHAILSNALSPALDLSDEIGAFVDNSGFIPAEFANYINGSNALGFFLLGGKKLIAGRIASNQLVDSILIAEYQGNWNEDGTVDPNGIDVNGIELVQILALESSFFGSFQRLFKGTGTAGFNDASYDDQSYGLGMNIPDELMGSAFDTTLGNAPDFGAPHTMWLTKPTKLSDLLMFDLIVRGTFLIFRSGALQWAVWSTPVASNATMTLTEAEKAEAAGQVVTHRSSTLVDASNAKAIVNVEWDWDPIANKYSGSPITLQDIGAANQETIKLSARNLGRGQAARDAIDLLLPRFMGRWNPYLSRPFTKITRSISPRFYEGYAPGDTCLFTDSFARDPITGIRGVSARAGMILRLASSPGGLAPGAKDPDAAAGEVDIFVSTDRATIWSPSAEIDETLGSGGYSAGYNSGTKALRCKQNEHSESSESADASNFAANENILITEKDPLGAPLQWLRVISSISGNDVILTTTLSAPAWDATKTYRITCPEYVDASTAQQAKAFMADDATGLIQSTYAPFQFGIQPISTVAFTPETHASLAELDPTGVSATTDMPYDTGYHRGIVRTINNLMDHKTAHQSPILCTTAAGYGFGSGTWILKFLQKHHFGRQSLGLVGRAVAVAPWIKGDGVTSVPIRVSLCPFIPSGSSLSDVVWPAPVQQATFITTLSTWATATEQLLDLRILDAYGNAWIGIEVGQFGETRGLAQMIERERT